ncbi:MAG TPA: (2Fe-2S)-binding protein [Ilumatobacter sp.]|nr:(2Fe-2S)-binding protein [Ilumatobacter sp.]
MNPRSADTAVVRVTVNGRKREALVPARMSLADLLRDQFGLTGTHLGCEQGVCGACNVLIDGETARACLTLAVQVDACDVTTVEGLSPESGLSELQLALAEHGGLQCGFCTPGVVVTLTELLASGTALDEGSVRLALTGNLCRCTGYQGIVDAVLALAAHRDGRSAS